VGAAAAIIVRREREIVSIFRAASATRADTARRPEELDVDRRVAFRLLVGHAVLRDVGDGRYYLDEPSWNAFGAMRRRLLVVLLTSVLALAVVSALIARGVIALGVGVPRLH
jgi:hypothetical protein